MKTSTPRTRLFTNEFEVGDEVAIIRARHGWHDGNTHGKITRLSTHEAIVMTDDHSRYEIEHPRDIRKL